MAAVRIPPTLRAEVGGVRELEARGETVREVIENLADEDVKTLDGLDTPVEHGETLILLPAMAGGA